ncbi:phosphate ABC transporter substrate-binding protein PstS [Deinococcus yavapaiensis]|uniref:Phosphate-binding protein n=1 Tax=Deinococcus yavapaiensis KR-236 TaxID=694435 RepID=A0A318SC77_9DEIO|nr:phosphate ABC transporter substrate-binding protein PstS [Deinococcus yavapaiensis]PYE56441.1 phosphate ABC transporter substrate-binding protein (PhoT family) [Deinococcus yavapaiensis KR-236]
MKKMLTLVLVVASAGVASAQASLTGAGASFPFPLYSKMFAEYKNTKNVTVNYQSVGSGAGQRQIKERTVDFGASDTPVSNDDLGAYPGKLLHVPTALGAVVPIYNIPGVDASLKFTGAVLADIYLGKIKLWNDAAITKLNSGVSIPALPITVVRRSDGSGTTGVFTDYLSKVSRDWKSKVGSGTAVNWPVGIGARGNEGVSGTVRQTPGAIGYAELVYAQQNKIDFGSVQNRAGNFVKASEAAVTAAAKAVTLPADTRVSITNPPATAANAYPISSFTYVLVYQDQKYAGRTKAQAQALKDLLSWMVTTGQQYNEPLNYAELPDNAQTRARNIIRSMTFGGERLN